jgi:CDP-diacylglycerol---serine O-phosphatidyltransferase
MPTTNPILRNLPNFLTSVNLLAGCFAVVMAIDGKGNLILASYLIFIAALFDFLDGFLARILKAYSEIGKQLDSLADMISFGLAPSIILYTLIKQAIGIKLFTLDIPIGSIFILASAFLIAVFSAIRLAKFNIDTRQKNSFIGLPTPACALLIASLPLIYKFEPDDLVIFKSLGDNVYFFLFLMGIEMMILKLYFLVPLAFILTFLLVSPFRMIAFKFETYSFSKNKIRYIFLGISILLFAVIQILSVLFIFLLYIILSAINNIIENRKAKTSKKNLEAAIIK